MLDVEAWEWGYSENKQLNGVAEVNEHWTNVDVEPCNS